MYGTLPWRNGCQTTSSRKAWSMLPEFYLFYQARKHRKRGSGYKAAAAHFGLHDESIRIAYNWVRENGNPADNPEWLEFYSETAEEINNGLD